MDDEDLNELTKISQIDISKFSTDIPGKVEKLRTVARFSQARRQNKNMSQSQICKLIGTSTSTLQRIR
jgi:DNA-binding transcriptional regulator YiaG